MRFYSLLSITAFYSKNGACRIPAGTLGFMCQSTILCKLLSRNSYDSQLKSTHMWFMAQLILGSAYEAHIAFRILGLGVCDLQLTWFWACSHEGHIAFTILGLGVCDLWLTLFKTHFGLCSHECHIAFMIFGLGVCDLWLTIFKLIQEHECCDSMLFEIEEWSDWY
jgi:hypothetical protein